MDVSSANVLESETVASKSGQNITNTNTKGKNMATTLANALASANTRGRNGGTTFAKMLASANTRGRNGGTTFAKMLASANSGINTLQDLNMLEMDNFIKASEGTETYRAVKMYYEGYPKGVDTVLNNVDFKKVQKELSTDGGIIAGIVRTYSARLLSLYEMEETAKLYSALGGVNFEFEVIADTIQNFFPKIITRMLKHRLENKEDFLELVFSITDHLVSSAPCYVSKTYAVAMIVMLYVNMVREAIEAKQNSGWKDTRKSLNPFKIVSVLQAYKHAARKKTSIPTHILEQLSVDISSFNKGAIMGDQYEGVSNHASCIYTKIYDKEFCDILGSPKSIALACGAMDLVSTIIYEAFQVRQIRTYLKIAGIRENNIHEFLCPVFKKAMKRMGIKRGNMVYDECLKTVAAISVAVQLALHEDKRG